MADDNPFAKCGIVVVAACVQSVQQIDFSSFTMDHYPTSD